MLCVILPAYNEEPVISEAARRVSAVLEQAGIPYHILFVDDGSKDGTWSAIERETQKSSHVSGLRFSRNFGKEAAMFAGLEQAKGDCCVVMDCDLQHPPEKIVEMYRLWEQGYEVVEGVKAHRGTESGAYRASAGLFYRLISKASGLNMAGASDFKLLDRKVVDALNAMPERHVFFRALSYWVGFRRIELPYEVQERLSGQSKWSPRALVRYALSNIASFSTAPMHLVSWMGAIFLLISVVLGIQTLVRKFSGTALEGFTTVILINLFSCGLIMLSLGIIGFYIARIYEEIKGRPRYIIAETCGTQHPGTEDTVC